MSPDCGNRSHAVWSVKLMPRITPITTQKLRKIFEKAGFSWVRTEGDHFVIVCGTPARRDLWESCWSNCLWLPGQLPCRNAECPPFRPFSTKNMPLYFGDQRVNPKIPMKSLSPVAICRMPFLSMTARWAASAVIRPCFSVF